ncbi:chloramphenicol acetyltransferase [Pseudoflavonifractor sp. 524-17]|uniref:CatA-like O-acetyltransferase n=1 Tax=Pseudoflavonifractor sp. 524-17 TaxID=2304577 RepID=UPI0013799820|nr:CatA-like O-acetyltransferase [Pseudoflavonifractor sp. 524-17]NCE65734.1 chloramphenicol acetyltransferase [Pseudoflavonifractor sp. 524-17]
MRQVDLGQWARRDHYQFYKNLAMPLYNMTFPVDVTGLRRYAREKGLSFYCGMIFLVTKAMEEVEAFHYREKDGGVVWYDTLIPSFTDLHPGSEYFHIVTLEAGDSLDAFCRAAREKSRAQTVFLANGPWDLERQIHFTCLPWFPLSAYSNAWDGDPAFSIPQVAWGKYEESGGRTVLPLSLELNHRLLDGIHAGQFYKNLSRRLAALEAGGTPWM